MFTTVGNVLDFAETTENKDDVSVTVVDDDNVYNQWEMLRIFL